MPRSVPFPERQNSLIPGQSHGFLVRITALSLHSELDAQDPLLSMRQRHCLDGMLVYMPCNGDTCQDFRAHSKTVPGPRFKEDPTQTLKLPMENHKL